MRVEQAHIIQVGRCQVAPTLIQVVHRQEHALDRAGWASSARWASTDSTPANSRSNGYYGTFWQGVTPTALQPCGNSGTLATDGMPGDGRLRRLVEEADLPDKVNPPVALQHASEAELLEGGLA